MGGYGGRELESLPFYGYCIISYVLRDVFPEHFHFARERQSGVFLSLPLQS